MAEIFVQAYLVQTQVEGRGLLPRDGFGGMLIVMGRMILLSARSSAYLKFMKEVRQTGIIPEHLEEYIGYGLFVGCNWIGPLGSFRPSLTSQGMYKQGHASYPGTRM